MIKPIIKTFISNLKGRFTSLLALAILFTVVFFTAVSCIDSVSDNSSDDPFGDKIIVLFANPDVLSGNGFGDSEIQVIVNTDTVPNGSNIVFNLTGSNLPSNLRGCILNADAVIQDGQASADYLAGIFIASGAQLSSDEPPIATVNVAANITPPGGGDSDSNFISVTLDAVGLIAPEDTKLEVPALDMGICPAIVGLTLEFAAIGLPDGTIVNFTLSNPALGTLNPTSAAVAGGSVVTEYTVPDCQAGTQVVTATAVLPNPFDFDPDCPNVPEADRTIREITVITQTQAEPTP